MNQRGTPSVEISTPLSQMQSSMDLPVELALDRPDWHGVVRQGGQPVAHASLWWRQTHRYRRHRVGFLGHFFARDAQAADRLLPDALAQLRHQGCTFVVGPMNGSTWRDYRWVTERGEEPSFFLEPTNPPEYPGHLLRNGFQPVAEYFSAVSTDLGVEDSRLERARDRLDRRGIQWSVVRRDTFVDDVAGILKTARTVFRGNPFYIDPDDHEFFLHCQQLRQVAPLDFIQVAYDRGRVAGFVFAVPDLLQANRRARVDTLVVKTLAVLPDRDYAGLGQVLLARVKQAAAAAGFRRAIHALVRDVPHLRRISQRTARPMRRYTLYAKALM